MATHCSILAWRIPWAEEPGGLQSTRSQTAGHDWSDLAHTHVITPQRGAGGLSLHLRRNPVDSSHFEHYQPPQKWVAVNQLLSPGLSVGFVLLEKTKCLCSEESHDTVKLLTKHILFSPNLWKFQILFLWTNSEFWHLLGGAQHNFHPCSKSVQNTASLSNHKTTGT